MAFGLGSILATAASADSPAPRWIASDAAIVIEVPRPAVIIERATRPRVQALLRAVPQIQKYYQGSSYRTLRTVVDLIAAKLDVEPEEGLRRLTAGGVMMAVEDEPGDQPRAFAIVTPEDAAFARRAVEVVLGLIREDASGKGKPDPVKSAEYRGVTGYDLGKAVFAEVDGSLVFSDKAETLKAVIDRARDGVKGRGSIADDDGWKARRSRLAPEGLVFGLARLDRLRSLDPKKFTVPDKLPPQATFLFGSWLEAIRTADWVEASVMGDDARIGATVRLPASSRGYREAFKGFIPGQGRGAPALLNPPGTIANVSLWRDLSAIWEAREELFTPEVQQGLAKLDTFAGQFFGGRDFGSGVLGALDPRWRLVIAHQDYAALKPAPDVKLPGFALIADLNPDDADFNQRLRVAFQSFVGLSNLNAAQKSAPPLELGSEVFEGVAMSTARFMVAGNVPAAGEKKAVDQRFNFTPSIAQVEDHFILSSSADLTRSLIHALKAPADASDVTLLAEADGAAVARLVTLNRDRLIMQNMLDKGHDRATAESEIDQFEALLSSFGHGRLTVQDGAEMLRFDLGFSLSPSRSK